MYPGHLVNKQEYPLAHANGFYKCMLNIPWIAKMVYRNVSKEAKAQRLLINIRNRHFCWGESGGGHVMRRENLNMQ